MSMNNTIKNRDSICAFNTNHCVVITKQKIATNFIMSFFVSDGIYETPNFFVNYDTDRKEWNVEFTSAPKPKDEESFISHRKGLYSFLNGELKKDVIILIRNPYERFKSALIQDVMKAHITPNIFGFPLVGSYILNNELGEYDKRTLWWNDNKEKILRNIENMDNFVLEKGYEDIFYSSLKVIFTSLLKHWISKEHTFDLPHNQPYHTTIQNIVLSAKNKKNIKIFDIDKADLNTIFSKYTIGRQDVKRNNQSGVLKKLLNDIIDSDEFISLKENYFNSSRFEVHAYEALSTIAKLENK